MADNLNVTPGSGATIATEDRNNVHLQKVIAEIDKPNAVFGELLVSELAPVLLIANPYEINPTLRDDLETFTGSGGSVDSSNNMFRCQTDTSIGSYGVIRSSGAVIYRPGKGTVCRITAAFTTGVASCLQFAGLFSLTETVAFGYNGENFGVIHEYDGAAEIQSIQVTTPASSGANCTVTLDGDAVAIALTISDEQTNAEEIRAGLAADGTLSAKWRFEQIDDTVFCISKTVGNKSGTMSYAAGTTGSAATLTEIKAGINKSSGNITQASWDSQPFSGFDPTQLNLYQIEYGYLGAAGLRFSIYNPNRDKFELVHSIKWANTHTTPNLGNPSLKIGWTAASLGSTTALTVTGASMFAGIQGEEISKDPAKATYSQEATIGTTSTNIITIKNRIIYGTRFNLGDISPLSVSIDNDHNKGIIVEIIQDATISGTQNFQYYDEANSIALIDTSGTVVSNGRILNVFTVGAGLSADIDLSMLSVILHPESTLTVAVRTVSGSATNTTAAITWQETK